MRPHSRVIREQSPQPRLMIYPSRAKTALVLLAALVFVVLGAALIAVREAPRVLVGVVSVLFFGSVAVYSLNRLARPTPSVIVDATGVQDTTAARSRRDSCHGTRSPDSAATASSARRC